MSNGQTIILKRKGARTHDQTKEKATEEGAFSPKKSEKSPKKCIIKHMNI